MKIIKDIVCDIKKELHTANRYYLAAKLAETDALSDTYRNLAMERLTDVDKLHDSVTFIIKNYRAQHGEPPAVMKELWNFEHEQMIEEVDLLKEKLRGM